MLKKCTRVLFLLLLAVFLLPTIFGIGGKQYNEVYADYTSGSSREYYSAGYVINNYSVDIIVGENNKLKITEVIDCKFTMSSHGILRYIPVVNEVKRADGSKTTQLAKIENVSISEQYSESIDGNTRVYRVGDPQKKIIGPKSYTISYDYDLGNDNVADYDELYFNIIGDRWDTEIRRVEFRIEMPKDFDASLIGFSKGYAGSSGYEGVKYSVEGRIITGVVADGLNAEQALTTRIQLPEGYFVGQSDFASGIYVQSFVIPVLMIILGIIIYSVYKRKNSFVQTVEFYPPEGVSSLDAALIYKGKVTNEDVISLIVQLASHGYITIEENKGKIDKINIVRKDYVGNNAREEDFLRALSSYGDSVTLSELRTRSFPEKVTRIKNKVNDKSNAQKYIKNIAAKVLTSICAFVALFLPMTVGIGEFFSYDSLIICIILCGLIAGVVYSFRDFKNSFMTAFVLLIFATSLFTLIYGQAAAFGVVGIVGLAVGLVSFIVLQYMSSKCNVSRTEKGLKLYGKILGFKQFIKTAEKDRLEALCEENPEYFYDILPYAYVLNVTDVWIKKFENIAIPPADWYVSSSGRIFTIYDTTRMINAVNRASRPITTSSSSGRSSGGGGFSGGGFSGGGSGGGGGGRW